MIKSKDNYFTSKEAAQFLGFSEDYIRRLIRRGKIKADKLGRNWIINIRDLSTIKRVRFPVKKEKMINGSRQ